jgi:diguanylate cyclase (GGDEF)-like protein/PAS domain S-box-containing protein
MGAASAKDGPMREMKVVHESLVQLGIHGDLPLCVVRDTGRSVTCEWANEAFTQLVSISADAIVGEELSRLVEVDSAVPEEQAPTQLFHSQRQLTVKGSAVRSDGCRVAVVVTTLPTRDQWWVVRLAVVDNQHIQSKLELSELRFAALAQHSPIPAFLSDVGMRLAHVNDAFTELLGTKDTDLLGTGWITYIHQSDVDRVMSGVQSALMGEPTNLIIRMVTAEKDERQVDLRLAPFVAPGHGPGFIGTAEDITERMLLQLRLTHQAHHDQLTGLPNRTKMLEELDQVFARPRRPAALLFVDLDDFKVVNDSLGHNAGDKLLSIVAERLRTAVRPGDVVARFGGDEFVILCPGVTDEEAATTVAERVLTTLHTEVHIGEITVRPSGSVGVAIAGNAQACPQDLLRDADIAMYEAKNSGKNQFAVCGPDARQRARDALELVSDLQWAIRQQQLEVVYQPVVDMRTRKLVGVEALSRWTHPSRGQVSPEQFIALAEQHDLIVPLTELVLERACRQMAEWKKELGNRGPRQVNVNISPKQLSDPDLVTRIRGVLARYLLDPSCLCVEITEGALMGDLGLCRDNLVTLREMGIDIALDDFGTGYSSLALLWQLPVSCLKIDRRFVADLEAEEATTVVETITALANSLGLRTVAEGVERPVEARRLTEMGCVLAQGWLYAKAMTPMQLTEWVTATGQNEVSGLDNAGEERAPIAAGAGT